MFALTGASIAGPSAARTYPVPAARSSRISPWRHRCSSPLQARAGVSDLFDAGIGFTEAVEPHAHPVHRRSNQLQTPQVSFPTFRWSSTCAGLVARIDNIIRQRGLKQVEAAKLVGLSQPDVSRFLRGRFQEFSMERLLHILTALGRDVRIVIREPRSERAGRLTFKA